MARCRRQRTLSAVDRVGILFSENRCALFGIRLGRDALDSADFDALEEKARARLSSAAYAFAAAGADDEITVADNIAAWRRLRLRPRMLNHIHPGATRVRHPAWR